MGISSDLKWQAVTKSRDMGVVDAFTDRLRNAVTQSGGATSVAQNSGIPLSTLNNYLAGRSEPKRLALAALARVLRRDLAWLLTGDGNPHMIPSDMAAPASFAAPLAGTPQSDGELMNEVVDAMLLLYAELGRRPAQSGMGRKCAQIHNAIAATAITAHERRRMLDLAVALQRQELTAEMASDASATTL